MSVTCTFFVVLFCMTKIINGEETSANRPIIGILAQELSRDLELKLPSLYKSYIAASYVKAVESSGARVVPIWIGQKRKYYEDILSRLNGVLFPGGAADFNNTDGYADAAEHIFNIAKDMNNKGNYFPIWGTCLGFEVLPYLDAGRKEFRAQCHASFTSMPLILTEDYRHSRLFSGVSNDVINVLVSQNVTTNNHDFCVTKQGLLDNNLEYVWRVMSLNYDIYGLQFISALEHVGYPFYATQFHPEKNVFEWVRSKYISHTEDSIKANRHFIDFFVNEARKNRNTFRSPEEETMYLIYNYQPIYTGKYGISFEQCYMFL